MSNHTRSYRFEITNKENNKTVKSGVLKIYDVPFSFDRYGVYLADLSYKNDKHPALSTEIPLFNYTQRSFARGGFLYIYYENRNKKIRKDEYDIYSIYGSDTSVDKYNVFNKATNKFSTDYDPFINFQSNEVVWVAYSEYRWKNEFLKKTIKDEAQLKKRFQKLDIAAYTKKCKDFYKQGYQSWASEDDPENSGYTSYYYYSLGSVYPMLDENPTTNNKTEQKTTDDNPYLVYSFALHDPMGVADDIIAEIKNKMFDYKTFMDELQIPVVNEGEVEPSAQDIGEYQALYQSAFILKNLLFSDLAYQNSNLKDYRNKVNVNRINAVLGLRERSEKANKIRGYRHIGQIYSETGYRDGLRDSLGTLLFSNYYQSVMVDACNLEKNVKSAAKLRAVKQLEAMLIDPSDIEIMYNPTYEAPANKWKDKIAATIPSEGEKGMASVKYIDNADPFQCTMKELLRYDILLTVADKSALFLSEVSAFATMLGIHVECSSTIKTGASQNIAKIEVDLEFFEKNIARQTKALGRNVTVTETFDRYVATQGEGFFYKPRQPLQPGAISGFEKGLHNLSIERDKSLYKMGNEKVTYTQFEAEERLGNAFLKSNAYRCIIHACSILGAVGVGVQMVNYYTTDSTDRSSDAWEMWGLLVANSTQVASAALALPTTRMETANMEITKRVAAWLDNSALGRQIGNRVFSNLVTRGMTAAGALGLGAGLIFAGISLWKGRNQYLKNNSKAGAANLVAGVVGVITVIMTVGSMYATTSMVASVLYFSNVVLLVIFVLASILASVFYLDFLQSFLTCTIFSADRKTPIDNEYFNKYARRYLFDNRTKKLTEDYKREELNTYKRSIPMSDFRNMLQWLINLQCCFGGKGRLHGYNTFHYQGINYRYPYFVTFKLQFRYFTPGSVFDLHMELYPEGLSRYTNSIIIPADGNAGTNYVEHGDNGFSFVERTFRVGSKIDQLLEEQRYTTQTLLSLNSCCYILFARIVGKDDSRASVPFPYSPDKETLYVAFYENLFVQQGGYFGSEISRYSGERHAAKTGKPYFAVGDPEVLIGTKEEIYNQIRPLNYR